MVLIQLNIEDKLDKKLKYYMLDNDLDDKRKAIKDVLNKALVK